MKKGGGKAKGAQFEREVAVALSLWASHGEREDLFWRSAMSGGRATVAHKKGKHLAAQSGDLCAVHPLGQPFIDKFYVELKHYKDLQYHGLITGTGTFVGFWESTVKQAAIYNKHPMLIAKQNRLPIVVGMPRNAAYGLGLNHSKIALAVPRLNLWLCAFCDFIKHAHTI